MSEKRTVGPLQPLEEKGKIITIYCSIRCVVSNETCVRRLQGLFWCKRRYQKIRRWHQIQIFCKIEQWWLVIAPQIGHRAGRSIHFLRTRVCTMLGNYWHKQFHRLVISLTLLGSLLQEIAWTNVSGDPQTDPHSQKKSSERKSSSTVHHAKH